MSNSSSIDFWHRVLLLGDEFWVLRDDADAEIERLREDFTDLLRLAANDASKYQAEIERLRKELAEKDDYIRTVSRPVGAHSYE